MTRLSAVLAFLIFAADAGAQGAALQVKAQARPAGTPAWSKGILPISPESYYNAIECGKQGGNPACVFWDTGLCKYSDFELAMYTPYKMVAYEVWRAVSQKQPAPQPNYAEAQSTRITVGVTPVRGAKDVLTDLVLKRGGKPVTPTAVIRQRLAQSYVDAEALRFTNLRLLTRMLRGEVPGAEGSAAKLFWSESIQRLFELMLDIEGPYAQLAEGSPHAVDDGYWQHRFLRSRGDTIAAGTSEINRNILAERVLGLPKD